MENLGGPLDVGEHQMYVEGTPQPRNRLERKLTGRP
jgi:hypothetical protein